MDSSINKSPDELSIFPRLPEQRSTWEKIKSARHAIGWASIAVLIGAVASATGLWGLQHFHVLKPEDIALGFKVAVGAAIGATVLTAGYLSSCFVVHMKSRHTHIETVTLVDNEDPDDSAHESNGDDDKKKWNQSDLPSSSFQTPTQPVSTKAETPPHSTHQDTETAQSEPKVEVKVDAPLLHQTAAGSSPSDERLVEHINAREEVEDIKQGVWAQFLSGDKAKS